MSTSTNNDQGILEKKNATPSNEQQMRANEALVPITEPNVVNITTMFGLKAISFGKKIDQADYETFNLLPKDQLPDIFIKRGQDEPADFNLITILKDVFKDLKDDSSKVTLRPSISDEIKMYSDLLLTKDQFLSQIYYDLQNFAEWPYSKPEYGYTICCEAPKPLSDEEKEEGKSARQPRVLMKFFLDSHCNHGLHVCRIADAGYLDTDSVYVLKDNTPVSEEENQKRPSNLEKLIAFMS